MGYRYPEPNLVEEADFSAQFEWEGQQLLFRRNRRERPVQVRPDERDQANALYETRIKRGRIGTAIVGGAAAVAVLFAKDVGDAPESLILFAIAMASMLLLALVDRLAARSATSAFDHRTPVGPPRTRTELRQAKVADQSYGALALGGVAAMLAFLAPWPPQDAWGWFAVAIAAIGGATAVFDIGLRLMRKRS